MRRTRALQTMREETAARIQISWYIDGKRYRELTNCWREPDAASILSRKEADYWRQHEFGVSREVGGSLSEATAAFKSANASRLANYTKQIRCALNALADGLGSDCSILQILPQDISAFRDDGSQLSTPPRAAGSAMGRQGQDRRLAHVPDALSATRPCRCDTNLAPAAQNWRPMAPARTPKSIDDGAWCPSGGTKLAPTPIKKGPCEGP